MFEQGSLLERTTGFEPATPTLARWPRWCRSPELKESRPPLPSTDIIRRQGKLLPVSRLHQSSGRIGRLTRRLRDRCGSVASPGRQFGREKRALTCGFACGRSRFRTWDLRLVRAIRKSLRPAPIRETAGQKTKPSNSVAMDSGPLVLLAWHVRGTPVSGYRAAQVHGS